jgi:2-phosphosulfolactate phosphatase
MSLRNAPAIYVHMLPSLVPAGALRGGVAVVMDVLRASSVMIHALAAGCQAVVPCGEVDEALAVARALPPGTAILGGERGGVQIEGFDLGNSPASYTPEVCGGKTVVMTTTNGTRAILASLEAERILVAAFVNLQATVQELALEFLKAHGRAVHLVCSGTEGFISLEDTLLAGAITAGVRAQVDEVTLANDEALIAHNYWLGTEHTLYRTREHRAARDFEWMKAALARFLESGRGGHNVIRNRLSADFPDVADVDRFALVAQLQRDPLRIVTANASESTR